MVVSTAKEAASSHGSGLREPPLGGESTSAAMNAERRARCAALTGATRNAFQNQHGPSEDDNSVTGLVRIHGSIAPYLFS